MERKFLLYLLYITLVEIREYSQENKNERLFWLTDLLHNIPFQLDSEDEVKNAYSNLIDNVKELGIEKWLETRETEFYSSFPQFKEKK
jgi:hypothetical protein